MTMRINKTLKGLALSGILITFFMAGCRSDKPSNEEEAEAQALKFAQAFFNFNYSEAKTFCDDSTSKRIDFFVSNLTQRDIDTIRTLPERPTIEIRSVRRGKSKDEAVALCKVENAFVLDTLGRTGHMVDETVYRINLTKRDGQWKVRMAGLLQNGK